METFDEVRYMQKEANIKTPIIIVKMSDDYADAWTNHIGVGSFGFIIMRINEDHFKKNSPAYNTDTVSHELIHVQKHYNSVNDFFINVTLSVGAGKTLEKIVHSCAIKIPHKALRSLVLAGYIAIPYWRATQNTKQEEAEAVQGSFESMANLGYCKALRALSAHYRHLSTHSKYPHGENYPTVEEYIEWSEQACKRCKGINPTERPDSPNFMRNGPA